MELLRDLPCAGLDLPNLAGSESYKLSAIARVRRCGRQGDIVGAVVPNLQSRSPPVWLRARCEVAVGAALAWSGTPRAWG